MLLNPAGRTAAGVDGAEVATTLGRDDLRYLVERPVVSCSVLLPVPSVWVGEAELVSRRRVRRYSHCFWRKQWNCLLWVCIRLYGQYKHLSRP